MIPTSVLAIGAVIGLLWLFSRAAAAQQQSDSAIAPPADPSTESAVLVMAAAIAQAEGFNVPNTQPARLHNPGDLTDPDTGQLRTFSNDADGYAALYNQVRLMLTGQSRIYTLDMSLAQVAVIYTGNDNPAGWARTVANALGVSTSTTLGQIAAAAQMGAIS